MSETTISEVIEEIKTEMCNNYCKYPYIWDAEKEGMQLDESAICEDCPLNRL